MASIGSKYQAGRKGTEIAALIRSDVRAACKADGSLKGCKVSVRYSGGSLSQSIYMQVTECPANIMNPEWVRIAARNPRDFQDGRPMFSAAALAIRDALDAIAAQYNRFDSDLQTDYFGDEFYTHTAFASQLEAAHRAQILAAHPACCGCSDCEDALASAA